MKRGKELLQTISRAKNSLNLGHFAPQMELSERYSYNPSLQWNPQVEDYFINAYGPHHFSRISSALTRPSCYSCIRVNTLKSTVDDVIEKLIDITGGGEHISKCEVPGLDYVVFITGSGPHKIGYDYTRDKPLKEVLVSRKCAEAVLRGAQVYAPGVVACSANVEKGDLVAVSVAVEQPGPESGWGVGITRGTTLQGSETDPYFIERKGMYIGQGTAMLSRAGIFRVPEGIAVDMSSRVYKLPSLHGVLEGEIFLQNLPSIITAHALDPQCGDRVLDMCAAPGGKTTAIAILMKNEGEVVAVDRSHNKVLNIQKLAAELRLTCITTYKLDATKAVTIRKESDDKPTTPCSEVVNGASFQNSIISGSDMENMIPVTTELLHADKTCKEDVPSIKANMSKADIRKNMRRLKNGPGRNHTIGARVDNSKGFSPNSFDRVLLDAPCSALGLRPRLFAGEDTIHSLRSHAKYQRKMFDQAVHLVRPGGVIVYSTCTINPGENEALVRYALDTYKFLTLASQHPRIGGPGIVGSCTFADGYTDEWLRPGEEELVQRFDPSSAIDTIGFFIAKFNVGPKDAQLSPHSAK